MLFKVRLCVKSSGRNIYERVEAADAASAMLGAKQISQRRCWGIGGWCLTEKEFAALHAVWAKQATDRDHAKWCGIWRAAFNNMPLRKSGLGQYGALARCLDIPLYSRGRNGSKGKFVAHNHIYAAMTRGYEPTDAKRREKLFKLAGAHGKLLARLKLRKLGVEYRYNF